MKTIAFATALASSIFVAMGAKITVIPATDDNDAAASSGYDFQYDDYWNNDFGSWNNGEEENSNGVEHVSSAEECPPGTYFEQEACACFASFQCYIGCDRLSINNPLEICECMSIFDYWDIFDHGLGPDCQGV